MPKMIINCISIDILFYICEISSTYNNQQNTAQTLKKIEAIINRKNYPLLREKITKDNSMFYICGWQGTIDGTLEYLGNNEFVTERNKREDGSYEVKFESYG